MIFENKNKLIILMLTACLLMIFSFFLAHRAKAIEFTVIINELSWAGSSYSANDEFIELKNLNDQETDLSGWYLTKLSGGEEKLMLEILENSVIEAESFFVIGNYGQADSVLNFEPDLADSSVSLSNSGFQIKLYNSQGELVDIAGDGNEPFAGDNEFKASMVRNFPVEDGEQTGSWSGSLLFENLDADVLDFATPAAENFLEIELNDPEDFASEDIIINDEDLASNDELIIEEEPASDDEVLASDDEVIIEEELASEDVVPEIIDEENASDDVLPDSGNNDEPDENIEEDAGQLIINEAAFKEDQDWVELKVVESGNFNGWKLFQGESLVFEIDDNENYQKNDFILLNLEKNITGTDNILVLRNENYQVQDVVIWSNNDGKFTKSKEQANFFIETEQWISNKDFEQDDSGAWMTSNDIGKGMSLARVSDIDTNSANDWSFTYNQTPGLENEIVLTEFIVQENDNLDQETFNEDLVESENLIENNAPVNLIGKLVINEILSQPFPKQTEWVEIYNSSAEEIEVTDFYLQEASGSKFYFKGIIPPKFYMIVKTKSMNNAGDKVELYSKDKQLLDQVAYGSMENSIIEFDQKKVILPYALVRDETGFWKLTTLPTPGTENIVQEIAQQKDEESKTNVETKKTKSTSTSSKTTKVETPKSFVEISMENIDKLKDNDLVSFEGVVTVDPGRFLKQRMYMQNEEFGLEVYFHKADWPDLKIGQKVQVKGKFARKDMPQIKISSKEDIIVNGVGEADLKELSVENQNGLIGFLAAGDGEVSEKLAGGFNLVTEQGDLPVCFRKNAGLNIKDLENGQRVFVSGILLPYKESVCLYPRINEDISILPSEVELGAVQVESLPVKKSLPVKIILMGVAGVVSAGLAFLYLLRKGKLKVFGLTKT